MKYFVMTGAVIVLLFYFAAPIPFVGGWIAFELILLCLLLILGLFFLLNYFKLNGLYLQKDNWIKLQKTSMPNYDEDEAGMEFLFLKKKYPLAKKIMDMECRKVCLILVLWFCGVFASLIGCVVGLKNVIAAVADWWS